LDSVERRLTEIESWQKAVDNRLAEGAKTIHGHKITLENVTAYQGKQNGSLQRLEDRFNSFYNLLMVALLGMAANLIISLVRR